MKTNQTSWRLESSFRFPLLLIFAFGLAWPAPSQVPELVNSGKCIAKAKQLYDSEKYELAINELLRVDPRDTNFVFAASQLADVYIDDGKYDQAIAVCQKALVGPSAYRATLLRSLGLAYINHGDNEKAYSTLTGATGVFPFDPAFPYYLGYLFYTQKKYAEAETQFFKTLDLNPYYRSAHSYLANCAMFMGQKTRAMFALGIYLVVNNKANSKVVMLEHLAKNELREEGTVLPDSNRWERLDAIVRSKIAFEKEYETKIPIDLGIVRQYQLLFDQLAAQPQRGNDPWSKFYYTVYADLIKSNQQEPFIYHILESTPIKAVATWSAQNKKKLQSFYDVVNASLSQFRKSRMLPNAWGYSNAVACEYYDNGKIESIGSTGGGRKTGKWYYFDSNGVELADGNYRDDNKVGLWKYFSKAALPTSVENYSSGEINVMNGEGTLRRHYYLLNGKVTGLSQFYYPCGALSESKTFLEGKRTGVGKTYFPDGKVQWEFTYANDSLHGAYTTWYENGNKKSDETYEKGSRTGTFRNYYPNGNIKSKGAYKLGAAEGVWTFYFENGKISQEGFYKNNRLSGEWNIYNSLGELAEKKNYNDKGELDGDDVFYDGGKIQYIHRLVRDTSIAITYYDKTGKILSHVESPEGTFQGRGFYPTGELRVEFTYLKGNRSGTWNFYYRTGGMESQFIYQVGKIEGESFEYYPDGRLKTKTNYLHDKLEGPYQGYYRNGKLKLAGNHQAGMKQQKWLSYNSNGSLLTDYFYLNNEPIGFGLDYVNGSISAKIEYGQEGYIKSFSWCDENGAKISEVRTGADSLDQIVTKKFRSGAVQRAFGIRCGQWTGNMEWYFPDGKLFQTKAFHEGKGEGRYLTSEPDGTPDGIGQYSQDEAYGRWTWYVNGYKYCEGRSMADERDSLWTYFYPQNKVSSTFQYLNGKRNGEARYFGLDGVRMLDKTYHEGDLIAYRAVGPTGKWGEWTPFSGDGKIVAYYANGKIAIEENYLHGEYDKSRKTYFPNGRAQSVYNYVNSMAQGACYQYYENGRVSVKMLFKDDNSTGNWEYYDLDGTLKRKEQYDVGVLNGRTEFFFHGKKTGELLFQGGYPVD